MRHCLPAAVALAILAAAAHTRVAEDEFIVKPYLQLANSPVLSDPESLTVNWHTHDVDEDWRAEVRGGSNSDWRPALPASWRRVAVNGVEPHRIYAAELRGLKPGADFEYRLLRAGRVVFAARGRARAPDGSPYRFVVFGDCGTRTRNQRAVAYQTYRFAPDFVFITGDMIQYGSGRIPEYRTHYFPIYNADDADPESGVPLLRSRLFFSTPGNHDISLSDFGKAPDALAYFLNWSLPLNGPLLKMGGPNTVPLKGPEEDLRRFLAAAGPAFPRMTMYSFDFGNSHWTVLDGNAHVDWTDYELRNWLARDLASARNATWRFVAVHQSPFDSNGGNRYEAMAIIADVLENGGADIVFSGNTHNYQRSLPVRLLPKPGPCGRMICEAPRVDGDLTIDRDYDGVKQTRANGVIYVITGAGGSGLDEAQQTDNPSTWQPFTRAFIADTPSLTVVDADGRRLSVRQVSGDGQELDRFILTK